jgi:hypothetical protein
MFPRKHYVTVSDMAGLTMYKLLELFESFKTRAEKAGKDKNNQGSVKVKKKQAPPTQLFETILAIVNPPLFTTVPKHREKIRTILALPEYEVPAHAMEGFKKVFQRKFGRNLNARAEHMAKDILQMAWGEFNNYKTVGSVLTKHQLVKAVNAATESNNPLHLLEEVRARTAPVVDEKKWDRERVNRTAELLQLAVDRLLQLLPPGRMRGMVERANNRVVSYRRKVGFMRQKLLAPANPAPPVAARRNSVTSIGSDVSTSTPTKATASGSGKVPAPQQDGVTAEGNNGVAEVRGALDLTSPEVLNQVLPVARSVELPFTSTAVADLELECDVSACRVFFDALDRLYMMTAAVNSLKNSWYNNTMRRTVAREKANQFKQTVKQQYLTERVEDKVKRTWLKHKRMETSKKKLDLIMKAVIARKAGYKFELSFIPKYGWVCVEDANGYAYWMDIKPRGALPATYEMPVYTVAQYFMLLKMQRAARLYLERLHERKRQREVEALAEVARLEAVMEEERRKGARVIKTRLSLVSRLLDSATEKGRRHHSHKAVDTVPTVESMLPWRYRFYEGPVFQPGFWALLRLGHHHQHQHREGEAAEDREHTTSLVSQYEIVTVFRIKESEGLCDVRNVKGKFHRNVHMNRLFIMNLDVGTAIEARYRQEQVFYRAGITHIDTTADRWPVFSIRYEDGETAAGLRWDALRPSLATLKAFLRGREEHLRPALLRHRRLVHFHKLRRERVQGFEERAAAMWEAQVANNPQLLALREGEAGGSWPAEDTLRMESRPESPVLLLGDGTSTRSETESPAPDQGFDDGRQEAGDNEGAADGSGRPDMTTVTSALVAFTGDQSEKHTALVPGLLRPRFRIDLKLYVPYSRMCNVYGWRTCEEFDASGRRYYYYVNTRTDEVSDTQPTYAATEVQAARRLQLAWLGYSARCKLWRRVMAINLTELIRETIKKCAKIAYVGYELEGVTSMQLMRRVGYWELAEVRTAFVAKRPCVILNICCASIGVRGALQGDQVEY